MALPKLSFPARPFSGARIAATPPRPRPRTWCGRSPRPSSVWRFAHEEGFSTRPPSVGPEAFRKLGDQQDQLLRTWEGDATLGAPLGLVSLVYKLVHFDRPVHRKGGTTLIKHVGGLAGCRRPLLDAAENEETDIECDVVVVGTGAGGAVVGRELAERGLAVAFVEEGDYKLAATSSMAGR